MFRCRHWSIAKYFGDAKPQCDKMCDYCTNPQLVRSELSMFQQGGKLGTAWGRCEVTRTRATCTVEADVA